MRRMMPILLLCLAWTASAQTLAPPKASGGPVYTIKPNDLLTIFVYKEPTLSGEVFVRPDGRISFPLVQDLPAAGLNPEQLKESIEDKLKDYVTVPNVTVIVKAIQSYKVFVMGKVPKPGEIASPTPISILQALALAGGFTEFAKPDEILIFRNTGEDTIPYKFNYTELIRAKNYSQNMLLKSGDVVLVP